MLRSLQHAALTVPDLDVGRAFYEGMGLETAQLGDSLVFRCPGRAQDQIRLVEGKKKRFTHVSFGTSAAELRTLQRAIEKSGTKLIDAPYKAGGDGIWFRDPDGDLVNVVAAPDQPQSRPPVAINNAGDFKRLGRRGAPNRDIEAKPRRLGHVLKFSLDLQRAIDFYTGTLGMKLSDRIGNMAAFLRFGGDSDHHTLALAQSQGTGLHHMSFEMGNLDQIQFCIHYDIAIRFSLANLSLDLSKPDGVMNYAKDNTYAILSARPAMGHTRAYAAQIDLAAMTPRDALASSGYCLANVGKEYLVYSPSGASLQIDLSGASGDLAVELFNPRDGTTAAAKPVRGGAKRTVTLPDEKDWVVYLRQ